MSGCMSVLVAGVVSRISCSYKVMSVGCVCDYVFFGFNMVMVMCFVF